MENVLFEQEKAHPRLQSRWWWLLFEQKMIKLLN